MSINRTDNNDKETQESRFQQQSDEAFINRLYDEVSQEAQSQPSELLDKRILSAAHKAINKSKKTNKKSHVSWYSTLATAASLMLVVSLVVLQQANILPSEQVDSTQVKGVAFKKPMNAGSAKESINPTYVKESFADQEVMTEQIDYKAEPSYSALSGQMASSVARDRKVAVNERTLRAMQYKKQAQLSKQLAVAPMMALPPVIDKSRAEIAKAQEKDQTIKYLSIKQFQKYTLSNKTLDVKNQWLWSLRSESDMEYIINLFQGNQKSLAFRLGKDKFKVIGTDQDTNKKSSLKNKQLYKTIILNTNN
jgi:hypothetical protein